MDSYIIRIYHRDRKDPKKVAGVVEEVGREGKRGFLGPDSLWRILTATSRESLPAKKATPRGMPRKGDRKNAMTFTEILKEINGDDE